MSKLTILIFCNALYQGTGIQMFLLLFFSLYKFHPLFDFLQLLATLIIEVNVKIKHYIFV